MKSPIFCCGYAVNKSYYYETLTDLLPLPKLTTTQSSYYTVHKWHIWNHLAHPRRLQTHYYTTSVTNVTDKDEPRNRQGAVHKISRSDCHAFYIGEIGRNLTTDWTQASDEERRCQQSHFVKFCLHYTTEHTKQHLEAWKRRSARPMIHFINSRDKNPLLQ